MATWLYQVIIQAFYKTGYISTALVDPVLINACAPPPLERGLSSMSYYACTQSLGIKCDAVSNVSSVIRLS